MHNCLDLHREGPVAHVYLNRPDVRNAFNDSVIQELTQAFNGFAQDASLRAVVLGGHGKAFCAGADLTWMRAMADYTHAQNLADAQALADMFWAIWSCPVPVVARVHGDCYAGGVGLAACADVVVAHSDVQFCLSEAKLGLMPGTIAPYVIRAMGEQAARRYFVTAERFDAAAAQAMGLVHSVVPTPVLNPPDVPMHDMAQDPVTPPPTLDEAVHAIVQSIVANGPAAVRACKQLVKDIAGQPIDAALRADTARRIADIRASPEGREGVQSFLSKRVPPWAQPTDGR
jgi:methylglutaconyl-CoA hydratase